MQCPGLSIGQFQLVSDLSVRPLGVCVCVNMLMTTAMCCCCCHGNSHVFVLSEKSPVRHRTCDQCQVSKKVCSCAATVAECSYLCVLLGTAVCSCATTLKSSSPLPVKIWNLLARSLTSREKASLFWNDVRHLQRFSSDLSTMILVLVSCAG